MSVFVLCFFVCRFLKSRHIRTNISCNILQIKNFINGSGRWSCFYIYINWSARQPSWSSPPLLLLLLLLRNKKVEKRRQNCCYCRHMVHVGGMINIFVVVIKASCCSCCIDAIWLFSLFLVISSYDQSEFFKNVSKPGPLDLDSDEVLVNVLTSANKNGPLACFVALQLTTLGHE